MVINQVFQDVLKSFETRTLYDTLCQFRPVSNTCTSHQYNTNSLFSLFICGADVENKKNSFLLT